MFQMLTRTLFFAAQGTFRLFKRRRDTGDFYLSGFGSLTTSDSAASFLSDICIFCTHSVPRHPDMV
jgi:hypothetical protein